MITHNTQFHDKIRKFPYIFVFFSYRKNFVGTQKRVRISHHGKRAIGVQAIEVRLYYLSYTYISGSLSQKIYVATFSLSVCTEWHSFLIVPKTKSGLLIIPLTL